MNCRIASIQVGLPQTHGHPGAIDPMQKSWFSGIFKNPVDGPVEVGPVNLAGDGQADLTVHGGPDKAILGYAAAHYPAWQQELGLEEFTAGAFGENLTIEGATEGEVCVGDIWSIGETVQVQVSQPRSPCHKLGRKWKMPELPKRVLATGRSGWYFRVLQTGVIEAGCAMTLQERLNPEWTIERVNRVRYGKEASDNEIAALADLPELAASWREAFQAKRVRV
ncbi:MOSC domain-containing protein [Maioricimonas sp. JC845]|uniref:MOSC domain-containing protein n=1 Tax=Maioricimonas sp. JC845 TaxID=3232138 RepID=UPI0034577F94